MRETTDSRLASDLIASVSLTASPVSKLRRTIAIMTKNSANKQKKVGEFAISDCMDSAPNSPIIMTKVFITDNWIHKEMLVLCVIILCATVSSILVK